uniref:2-aminoethanethiol (cysteamine) dioxygenase a n=1 Tax=Electrophorus electricus TaxID=8005 RepID=A0A4W4G7D4_ELEEL
MLEIKIANQAYVTFKSCRSSAIGENKVLLDNKAELTALLTEIRASDLKIAPPKKGSKSSHKPPVTYMHICETDAFSMGVFLLKRGASIPLHDHPGMNGMLKVLYGKVKIMCLDRLEKPPAPGAEAEAVFDPPLSPFQKDALSLCVRRCTGEFTVHSEPCALSPVRDNIHQIDAVDGPAAFLDILAPPYDPAGGRDCHYYRVLQTVARNVDKESDQSRREETWLLEIPQPDGFWCGGETYPGPEVSV